MWSMQQQDTSSPLLLQPALAVIAAQSAQSDMEQLILLRLHLWVHLSTPVVTSGLHCGVAPAVFKTQLLSGLQLVFSTVSRYAASYLSLCLSPSLAAPSSHRFAITASTLPAGPLLPPPTVCHGPSTNPPSGNLSSALKSISLPFPPHSRRPK